MRVDFDSIPKKLVKLCLYDALYDEFVYLKNKLSLFFNKKEMFLY